MAMYYWLRRLVISSYRPKTMTCFKIAEHLMQQTVIFVTTLDVSQAYNQDFK